jgi:hypothetical protein
MRRKTGIYLATSNTLGKPSAIRFHNSLHSLYTFYIKEQQFYH